MSYKEDVVYAGKIQVRKHAEVHVRLLREKDSNLTVDIREYLFTNGYTGWTKKGIRLSLDNIKQIHKLLDGIFLAADSYNAKRIKEIDKMIDKADDQEEGET